MTQKQRGGGPIAPSDMVQVRALVPLWDMWELVAPGTVYEQPAHAAAEMAALGMVELVAASEEAD